MARLRGHDAIQNVPVGIWTLHYTFAHLIAELVVDQRLSAKGPQVHRLVEPDGVVVHINLGGGKQKIEPSLTHPKFIICKSKIIDILVLYWDILHYFRRLFQRVGLDNFGAVFFLFLSMVFRLVI